MKMTDPITFTDANGVEWTLCKWRKEPGGELRLHACEADLRAAAESQGYALVRLVGEVPTRDELRAIVDDVTAGSLLAGVEVTDPICRALFTAGSASRQAEVDRLTAERDGLARGQDDLNKCLAEAESELAAAKKKLAEVYGKLSDAEYSKGQILGARYEWERRANAAEAKLAEVERELACARYAANGSADNAKRLYHELERERRVVEAVNAILEKGPRYTDRHLEAAADAVVDEIRQPLPACVPGNSPGISDGSTRFTFAVGDTVVILAGDDPRTGKTADIIGLYPKGCATVRVHGEPPPRAPDVYPAFPLACLEKIEPQEEPRPSGEARCQCGGNVAMGSYDAQVVMLTPFRRGPLPQLVGIDACIATEIAWLWLDGIETVASCCGHNKAPAIISVIEDDAERMERLGYELYEYPPGQDGWRWTYRAKSVSRCNAPEPSASVPRSEVEAFRDEARLLRDDFRRQADGPPRDHNAWIRHRVWGYVHECLEELLAKGQVKP